MEPTKKVPNFNQVQFFTPCWIKYKYLDKDIGRFSRDCFPFGIKLPHMEKRWKKSDTNSYSLPSTSWMLSELSSQQQQLHIFWTWKFLGCNINFKKNCQKKNCERKLHEITHAHGPRGRFRRFGKVRFSMPALSRQMRLGSKDFASNPGENDSNCPTSADLYISIFLDKPKNCFFNLFWQLSSILSILY